MFKVYFFVFLAKSVYTRQFRRRTVFGQFQTEDVSREIADEFTNRMMFFSHFSPRIIMKKLDSHESGLTEAEAISRREVNGLNEVKCEKLMLWQRRLWLCYRQPFNLLLTAFAFICILTGNAPVAVIIMAMVMIPTVLRFLQEEHSDKLIGSLKAMVSNKAVVMRRFAPFPSLDGVNNPSTSTMPFARIEVPIKNLVVGEIVQLAAGDMVPADVRILSAKDLFVSELALSGEPLPLQKYATQEDKSHNHPLEVSNLCFMGTNVVSGTATAIVVGTGSQTYFGSLASGVNECELRTTEFQISANKVSWLLIRFMLVMLALILFINGIHQGSWLEIVLFMLAIAISLTPEILPVLATATINREAALLRDKKIIVKNLDEIQCLGAMDVLCTDKTGVLTQDKVVLDRYVNIFGEITPKVLKATYLNSLYQTGQKNLLDVAVLNHVTEEGGLNHMQEDGFLANIQHYEKVAEIPFDVVRRRMSVVVKESEDRNLLICKGELEEVLSVCTQVQYDDVTEPLSAEIMAMIQKTTKSLNKEGLSIATIAMKTFSVAQDTFSVADEEGLTLMGYAVFLDPPKETATSALASLKENGIDVKIMTEDNEFVALKECKDVGLQVKGILLGQHIDRMSDNALSTAVADVNVFAKLSPLQKERLIRVLRDEGHVVGFMGDDINDAPALHAADVGISVEGAADIAKEAAGIILLEKSLLVLAKGVADSSTNFIQAFKCTDHDPSLEGPLLV